MHTNDSEVSLKRYKYNGKERDEETNLDYYGARYYASWLCRFISVDPQKDSYVFQNSFAYAANSPVTMVDVNGESPGGTGGDGGDEEPLLPRYQRIPSKPVSDANSFIEGLNGFSHNLLSIPYNVAAETLNVGIDVINYVGEEIKDPGSKRPLEEAYQAIGNFGEALVDDAKRIMEQDIETTSKEALGVLINPTSYEFTIELLLFKKGVTGKSKTPSASTVGNKIDNVVNKTDDVADLKKVDDITDLKKFADLDETGKIDPNSVRFSQNSIKSSFKNGRTLNEFIEGLKDGSISPDDIPAIRIVEKDNLIYTLDNRRLYSFQKAGIPIKFQKLNTIPKNQQFKFTTTNNGKSIKIR